MLISRITTSTYTALIDEFIRTPQYNVNEVNNLTHVSPRKLGRKMAETPNSRPFESFRKPLTHAIDQKPTTRTADHLTSRGIWRGPNISASLIIVNLLYIIPSVKSGVFTDGGRLQLNFTLHPAILNNLKNSITH